jgi:hypothetical protein
MLASVIFSVVGFILSCVLVSFMISRTYHVNQLTGEPVLIYNVSNLTSNAY